MIIVINYLLTLAGLCFCFYIMISKRFDTSHVICATKLNLWMFLWLCLLLASDFVPTAFTTTARAIALVLNVIAFKEAIKLRKRTYFRKRRS
ncbi:hypothetical protein ACI2I3_00840 [Psychrobacter namhaensis]|uniref:Holin n=1 Tax=Psychrobacter namhaensis TaxID=292734 RepID=A0ABW8L4R7_9GAMM